MQGAGLIMQCSETYCISTLNLTPRTELHYGFDMTTGVDPCSQYRKCPRSRPLQKLCAQFMFDWTTSSCTEQIEPDRRSDAGTAQSIQSIFKIKRLLQTPASASYRYIAAVTSGARPEGNGTKDFHLRPMSKKHRNQRKTAQRWTRSMLLKHSRRSTKLRDVKDPHLLESRA